MEMDRKALLLVFYATLLLCTSANVPCVTYNLTLSLEEAIHLSDIVMTGRAIGQLEEGERGTLKGRVSYYFAYKNDTQLRRLWLGSADVNNFHSAEKTGEIALFFLFREPNGALALQCMSPFSMLVPRRRAGGAGQTSQATGSSSSLSALLHLVERVGRGEGLRGRGCERDQSVRSVRVWGSQQLRDMIALNLVGTEGKGLYLVLL